MLLYFIMCPILSEHCTRPSEYGDGCAGNFGTGHSSPDALADTCDL